MKRACKNCEHFDPIADTATGLCRFSPPRANQPFWSTVQKTDWCSQFVQGEEDRRQELLRTAKKIISDGLPTILAGGSVSLPFTYYSWFIDELVIHCQSLGFTPIIGGQHEDVTISKAP